MIHLLEAFPVAVLDFLAVAVAVADSVNVAVSVAVADAVGAAVVVAALDSVALAVEHWSPSFSGSFMQFKT